MSWLLGPFADATWVDWLDIVALTAVIHRVLVAMRGTRAVQSMIGLAIVSALYLASGSMGLSAVHWVLDNLFVYLVLAVLILFQDDIRRALARTGGMFGVQLLPARVAEANVIEELIKAVFALAQRRIGALILIERADDLDRYVEGAHRLDAALSTELLQALFQPSSPLHDGAVVISDGRILAAGVFLPLSMSKDLSRVFGTRHRAAIGVSEETDGICIVVSEERGTVTLAHRGVVTPIVDANDLRQRIGERMGEVEPTAPAAVGASHG
jgi:diadenylate cyclase